MFKNRNRLEFISVRSGRIQTNYHEVLEVPAVKCRSKCVMYEIGKETVIMSLPC